MNPEMEMSLAWGRRIDLQWIGEKNLIFQSAVRKAFDQIERGAVVIDVTMPPVVGGLFFSYWPQSDLEEKDDDPLYYSRQD
jgi:hypothetical protein